MLCWIIQRNNYSWKKNMCCTGRLIDRKVCMIYLVLWQSGTIGVLSQGGLSSLLITFRDPPIWICYHCFKYKVINVIIIRLSYFVFKRCDTMHKMSWWYQGSFLTYHLPHLTDLLLFILILVLTLLLYLISRLCQRSFGGALVRHIALHCQYINCFGVHQLDVASWKIWFHIRISWYFCNKKFQTLINFLLASFKNREYCCNIENK